MSNVKKATQSEVSQKADPDRLTQMDHEDTEKADEFLRKTFGTDDPIFLHGLWQQLKKLSFVNGEFSEGTLKFLASIVAGVEPRDPLEAMLVAQMAAIHKAMFDQSLKLALPLADQTEILSTKMKLTRTFMMQLDALKRHRSKPEQQLVQHVMVAQGGQAIVGPVHQQQREDAGATEGQPKRAQAWTLYKRGDSVSERPERTPSGSTKDDTRHGLRNCEPDVA
jgi:hypothetical protein